MIYDLCIIGSGVAALTASIYTSRANINTLLIEGGSLPGGYLITSHIVENFPGFPEGIEGYELIERIKKQSIKFGTKIVEDTINKVSKHDNIFTLQGNNEYKSKSVIIATGAKYKELDTLKNIKVNYCATCDGFLFKDKVVAIIGGGDTAVTEAIFLSKLCKKVYIIHRNEKFKSSLPLSFGKNVEIIMNTEIKKAEQKNKIILNDSIEVDGVFLAIGHIPNTELVQELVDLEDGYILTYPGSTRTKTEGLFAAGDVQDYVFRQAITSAGTGCMAGMEVIKYINEKYN